MGIFEKRAAFKPFEYPEVIGYKEAIQHSYWLVGEWNFIGDVQDFRSSLSEEERGIVRRALLAISQIEVSVKRFWGKLGDRFPKAEFDQVGAVFAESEVRHADAYSHLLEVLGLNEEFDLLLDEPVIQGRVEYLTKYLKGAADGGEEAFTLALALFAIFIENVSLFGQFAIIKSFNKHRNLLKDIDNVVQATQKEEQVHALLGVYLINKIREENPGWFDDHFYAKLRRACVKARDAEVAIVDWIYGGHDLPFLPRASLVAYLEKRFDDSMEMVGGERPFGPDPALVAPLGWFEDEILAVVNPDFFYKKPVTYSSKTQPVTAEDLF